MSNRGHGEGTLYLDKKQDCYYSRFTCVDPESRLSVRKSFKGTKNKRESMEIGRRRKADFERYIEAPIAQKTVAELIDQWLAYKSPVLRKTSYLKYETCMKSYIIPRFGAGLLPEITTTTIDALFTALKQVGGKIGQGLSTQTIDRTRCYLKQFLSWTVQQNLTTINEANKSRPIRQERKVIHTLNEQQLNDLVYYAKNMDAYTHMVVKLTALSGIRLNEAFGLTWDCVDFQRNVLHITKQLRAYRGINEDIFAPPKTEASRRRIPMSPNVMIELRRYKDDQDALKAKFGNRWNDNNLVFPNLSGKPANAKNFIARKFTPLCRIASVHPDFTFHDLRHTHATLLLIAGINPKVVCERLGHSSVKITLDTYSHVVPSIQEHAVTALDDLLAMCDSTPAHSTTGDFVQ